MSDFESLLSSLYVVGLVLLLVLGIWLTLTVVSGILRRRMNFLMVALQLFALIFLLRDVGLPLFQDQFGFSSPDGLRRLLTACLIVAAGFVFDRLVRHFIWDGLMVANVGAPAPRLLRGAFTALVMLVAVGMVVGWVYDQSVTGLVAASGVLAIVIGYAAQTTLADLLAGVAMSISPAFKIGDIVDIDGAWVKIKDQNWRVTETLHVDGRAVFYPNSMLAKIPIGNVTGHNNPLRQAFRFSADSNCPPELMRDVALQAIGQCRLLHPKGKPAVWIDGHGAHGFDVTAYFHTNWENYIAAQVEVANLLWYGFHKNGVAIAFNRSQVFATDWQAATAYHPRSLIDAVPSESAFASACRDAEELRWIDPDSIARLRDVAQHRVFGRYEVIVKAGDESDNLFLLARGSVDVLIPMDGGEERVATLMAPTLVGFMALAMKQPRSATLVAVEPVEAYEIDGAAFIATICQNEATLDRLVEIGTAMQIRNEAARNAAAASEVKTRDRASALKEMFKARFVDLLKAA